MNGWIRQLGGLICACFCAGAVLSAGEPNEVEYKVRIKGARDNAVKRAVKESARTYMMRKRPPSTYGQLRRRMEKDVPLIETILEANGYYDGSVTMDLNLEESPVRVYIRLDQGEQYRFRTVDIQFVDNDDERLNKIKPTIRRKNKVVATDVFNEQQRIIEQLARRGYPFGVLTRRDVEIDRENQVVDLMLEFDPGPLAFFGPAKVNGLEKIPDKYIHRQIPWNEGARYDAQLVHDFETRLLSAGQFGSARVTPQQAGSGTNAIPMNISLNERAMRTVRLGVNYSDIGPGGRIDWEHRNLFGGGERFETSLSGSPIEIEWEGRLIRAGFLDGRQSLVLDVNAGQEMPDAYDAKRAVGTAMVLRDFNPNIQAGLGMGYSYSLVEQFDMRDRFAYVLFPVQAVFDYRDDRLNPQRGGQLFGQTSWYEDTQGFDSFLKSQAEARKYFMLWREIHLSSAFRLTLGSIDGADVAGIPADERFYAGGGGSIRGYEYQSVGPKLNGTPTGGDKLLEFSAELRVQPGTRLGYVAFIDGGTVYNDLTSDDANRALRYGAGLGLRWFTGIGPLRADLAYPLNPDDTQKERLQFYISLGQAF